MPGNKDRLRDEIKNITVNDKRVNVVRKDLSEEDRWRTELMDAFGGLCVAFSRGDVTISGLGRSASMRSSSMGPEGSLPEVHSDDLPELGR